MVYVDIYMDTDTDMYTCEYVYTVPSKIQSCASKYCPVQKFFT